MYMYVVPLIYIDLGVVAFIFIGGTFKVREYFVQSKPTFYKFRPKIIILCATQRMSRALPESFLSLHRISIRLFSWCLKGLSFSI